MKKYIVLFFIIIFAFIQCSKNEPFSPLITSTGNSNLSDGRSMYNLYVLNTLSSNVSVVDLNSFEVNNTLFKAGKWANDLKIMDNKYLLVVNSGNNNVEIYNSETSNISYIFTPSSPEYIAVYNNSEFYLSVDGVNKIIKYNIDGDILSEISLPNTTSNPWKMKIYNNKLYIACYGTYYSWANPNNFSDASLIVVDIDDNSIEKIITGFTNLTDIDFYKNYIYAVATGQYNNTGKVYKIDISNYSIDSVISIGGSPGVISINNYYNNIFIGDNGWSTFGLYLIKNDIIINGTSSPLINSGISAIIQDNESYLLSYIADFNANKVYIYNNSTLSKIKTFNNFSGPVALVLQKK